MHRLKLDTPKARLPLILQTENRETYYLAQSFAMAQKALNVLKEFEGMARIPGLQEGVKALVIVFDMMQVWSSGCIHMILR
jgi:hypothetical protein